MQAHRYNCTLCHIVRPRHPVRTRFDAGFLKEGRTPGSAGDTRSDISRIQADTGYEPQYLVEKSIPDYIGWLKAGNAE